MFFHDGKIKTWEDLEAFELPDQHTEEYQRPLREFVEVCRQHDYSPTAMTRSGVSATYLAMGFEHFFLSLIDDPDVPEALMRRYAEWTAELVPVLNEIGFDIIHTADDVAGKNGPLLSPEMFRERFWPHVRKVGDALEGTDLHWCYHSDGDLSMILDDMLDLGIDMLNPVEPTCMDIVALKERFQGHSVLSGNVDVHWLSKGTPERIEGIVKDLLRTVAPGGGFMLSSGNSVARYTTVENVKAMCDTGFRYGGYPIQV